MRVREDQPRPCHSRPRTGRTQSQPRRGHHDSQSVKTTEAGGPRGYDAGKKINGRKRHDQPKQTPRKGLRSDHRLRHGLPLRRLRHAPPAQNRPNLMSFETDS